MSAKAQPDRTKERLLSWLQERENEMAALLADFVAVPTENPPGRHYREFADMFENYAARLGFRCETLGPSSRGDATEAAPPCLTVSYGEGERTLYFHGHYDVVPAQSGEQFRPDRKEHFLFGRGACDMKGGIVSMLYAILALRECGAEMAGKVQLVLVPDEETGGARGSVRLAALFCPKA